MAEASRGDLPFSEQIDFFRQKANVPSRTWTELWQREHDHGFMVAGATKDALIQDFRASVDKAISEGTTLREFRKDFDAIVSRHGWSYRGSRGWRSRIIYETNLRQSYNAGRTAQAKAVSRSRPFWRYRHSIASEEPRDKHLGWDGLVLRHDDPWWDTHTPQNGWGCKCYIETLAQRDLDREGKDGPDQAPPLNEREVTVGTQGPVPRTVRVPEGIDPGFAHQPGRAWIERSTPRPLDTDELLPSASDAARAADDALPAARSASAERVMDEGLDEQAYVDGFLGEFDIQAPDRWTLFEDVVGEPLLISDALFRAPDGRLKVFKRGRQRFTRLFADTIKDPDEIWQDWAEIGGRRVLRRRYVARWQLPDEEVPTLAVFEQGPHGWVGVTAFDARDVERAARRGVRVYRREEE